MPARRRLEALRRAISGRLVEPDDPAFEEERALFNSMIVTRPAAIAKVTGPQDIAAAIRFARDADMPIAVRAGGHSVAGHSLVQGGVVLDLRLLKSIEIDPASQTAKVGGGATWGDFDRAAQVHGLATTGGRVTSTGVGGYTLGGGNGWLDRAFGLAVDNLLAVELVTVDGRQVTASAQDNPDLFWALRGGGGNFGVATSFTFRLHRLETVYAGLMLFPEELGEQATRTYRDLMDRAPRELCGGMLWMYAPDEEFMPRELANRLCAGIAFCFVGGAEQGGRYASALRAIGPGLDTVGSVPYADFNGSLDDPAGLRNYWTAEYLEAFTDPALQIFVEHSRKMPPRTRIQSGMLPWGGAVSDVAEDETPVASRHARWHAHPFCVWERPEDDEPCMRWGRGMRDALKPFATGNVYLNFIGDEGQDRIVAAFGKEKYERLARIKAKWDPQNVLRGNQNIKPMV